MNSKAEKLTGEHRNSVLQTVPKWGDVKGRDAIQRQFVFDSFADAFAFMTGMDTGCRCFVLRRLMFASARASFASHTCALFCVLCCVVFALLVDTRLCVRMG